MGQHVSTQELLHQRRKYYADKFSSIILDALRSRAKIGISSVRISVAQLPFTKRWNWNARCIGSLEFPSDYLLWCLDNHEEFKYIQERTGLKFHDVKSGQLIHYPIFLHFDDRYKPCFNKRYKPYEYQFTVKVEDLPDSLPEYTK